MKAIGKKVSVVMDDRKTKEGDIHLPASAIGTNAIGTVTSAGAGCEVLKQGDRVHVPDHLGTHFRSKGVDYIIVDEAKIDYKVEDE